MIREKEITESALQKVKAQKENFGIMDRFDVEENYIVRQALEKQIPKKPNKAIDSTCGIKNEVHVCPVCDYYLTEVHFIAPQKIEPNKKITYCENCGQAIDWSE
jgi:uncharacterized protein with PIN domain